MRLCDHNAGLPMDRLRASSRARRSANRAAGATASASHGDCRGWRHEYRWECRDDERILAWLRLTPCDKSQTSVGDQRRKCGWPFGRPSIGRPDWGRGRHGCGNAGHPRRHPARRCRRFAGHSCARPTTRARRVPRLRRNTGREQPAVADRTTPATKDWPALLPMRRARAALSARNLACDSSADRA